MFISSIESLIVIRKFTRHKNKFYETRAHGDRHVSIVNIERGCEEIDDMLCEYQKKNLFDCPIVYNIDGFNRLNFPLKSLKLDRLYFLKEDTCTCPETKCPCCGSKKKKRCIHLLMRAMVMDLLDQKGCEIHLNTKILKYIL